MHRRPVENSQIISLVAIAISLVGVGLAFVSPLNLESELAKTYDELASQSNTIQTLDSQLNDNSQLVDSQKLEIETIRSQLNDSKGQIARLQNDVTSLNDHVNSLENRVASLEQKLQSSCMSLEGCTPPPHPTTSPCDQPNSDNTNYTNPADGKIPTSGLVGEWIFENNIFDTSGHGNNGINCGITFEEGKIGRAANFNGSGLIRIPYSPTLDFPTTSFSISLWVKTTASYAGWIVEHRRNNDGCYAGYSIEGYGNSGKLVGRLRVCGPATDTAANFDAVTNPVNDGAWHHIVFVVDRGNNTSKIYQDNVLVNHTDITALGSITQSSIGIDLGYTSSPNTSSDSFVGQLDRVRIYNRALSSDEVNLLYNENAPPAVGITATSETYDPAKGEIFVTNSNSGTVSVISDNTNSVVATIPVGKYPEGTAYDPAKGEIFVTNLFSSNISVISDKTNSVIATIPTGPNPYWEAYDPAKGEIFVTDLGNSIYVISDSTNSVVSTIPLDVTQSQGIAYDPAKGEIFVADYRSKSVTILSDTTNSILATVPVGNMPQNMAYDSTRGEMFVTDYGPYPIGSYTGPFYTSVISDSTNSVVSTIPVGISPFGVAYDQAKDEMFVTNLSSNANSVSVISDSTNSVVSTIPVGTGAWGVVYDSKKGEVFVTNSNSNTISVISDKTNSVIATIL